MKEVYRLWAPVYDLLYHAPLAAARRTAVLATARHGRVLEVGIGTGLTLDHYPCGCTVVGVDLSEAMLQEARRRLRRHPHRRMEGLFVMDACHLGFPDRSFDAALGAFVIGLVPDAEAALDEMVRVLKPGGELVIANRFAEDTGGPRFLKAAAREMARRIGWGTGLSRSRVTAWASARGIQYVSETRCPPAGQVCVIRLRLPHPTASITAASVANNGHKSNAP